MLDYLSVQRPAFTGAVMRHEELLSRWGDQMMLLSYFTTVNVSSSSCLT
jgi:hypothetical protein